MRLVAVGDSIESNRIAEQPQLFGRCCRASGFCRIAFFHCFLSNQHITFLSQIAIIVTRTHNHTARVSREDGGRWWWWWWWWWWVVMGDGVMTYSRYMHISYSCLSCVHFHGTAILARRHYTTHHHTTPPNNKSGAERVVY